MRFVFLVGAEGLRSMAVVGVITGCPGVLRNLYSFAEHNGAGAKLAPGAGFLLQDLDLGGSCKEPRAKTKFEI